MALPWVRLDANIASHDKITDLLEERPAAIAWQAAFSYVCSLGHCGSQQTDGLIRFSSLPHVHGTKRTAELLVQHHLWAPDPEGWRIPNWANRQQSEAVSKAVRNAQRAGALKANCTRWHGKDCHCWQQVA
jgi:hypothetical protein